MNVKPDLDLETTATTTTTASPASVRGGIFNLYFEVTNAQLEFCQVLL